MIKLFKIIIFIIIVTITTLSLSSFSYAANHHNSKHINPIISTNWLNHNIDLEDLVIIDIRKSDLYNIGHIENSINIPFEIPSSEWITMKDDLLLELPSIEELSKLLSNNGIQINSKIIIVTSMPNKGEPPYSLANATRVADTLIYSGVKSVSILDGGYDKWNSEGKTIVTTIPNITPTDFDGVTKNNIFVSKDYVNSHIGKSVLIDGRDANVYNGEILEPWAEKAGHIPSAISIPTPSLWKENGIYQSKRTLKRLIIPKIGCNKSQEIIVYCGVGGYASSLWFVLSEILGYTNVKLYDGSAQEWSKYYNMEI